MNWEGWRRGSYRLGRLDRRRGIHENPFSESLDLIGHNEWNRGYSSLEEEGVQPASGKSEGRS